MDHSENDKRFCVYTHTDLDGNIRYIGSGTEKRSRNKAHRDYQHLEIWDSLVKNIIHSNLTKNEAAKIEEDLILKFWETGLLLNKKKSSLQRKPIIYSIISKFLEYDESSPTCLKWIKSLRRGGYQGELAGYLYSKGYGTCCIDYTEYKIHRLVWVLVNKQDLDSNLVIDHIDRNKHNNKIDNLRLVTCQENMNNSFRVLEADYVSVWWQSRRKYYVMRVVFEDGSFIHKSISPHVLFPNDNPEIGKQKVLAIFEEMKNIISEEKAKLGTKFLNEEWIRNNVFSLVKRNKSFNNF